MKKEIEISELRTLQLALLDRVMDFCSKNGLRCWLGGGSLLGAVRHHGYIPWDDDIDLIMPRKDYQFFLKNYPQTEENRIFSLETSRECYYTFAKVYNDKTLMVENFKTAFSVGVAIDVFPFDNLPDDPKRRSRYIRNLLILKRLQWVKLLKVSSKKDVISKILLSFEKLLTLPFSLRSLVRMIDKYSQKYSDENDSEFWGPLSALNKRYREIMERRWFDETVLLDFETEKYPCPKHWHEILTHVYGNYMVPPPRGEQIQPHASKAYWK